MDDIESMDCKLLVAKLISLPEEQQWDLVASLPLEFKVGFIEHVMTEFGADAARDAWARVGMPMPWEPKQ